MGVYAPGIVIPKVALHLLSRIRGLTENFTH